MLLERQGSGCAICREGPSAQNYGKLHVDHDRATGLVRGLLCQNCNTALGLLDEKVENVRMAVRYLEPFQA